MAAFLPFEPANPHYDFTTELDGAQYKFTVRWNARDLAWFFDMDDAEGRPVIRGVKVTLGTHLGRRSAHPFFSGNLLWAVDNTLTNANPTFEDMGRRVQILHLTSQEYLGNLVAAMSGNNTSDVT